MAGVATFKLTASPTFASGATLKLFEQSAFPSGRPTTGVGPGIAALDEVVVDAHGFALFGALEPGTGYIAGGEVAGVWRYISFRTSESITPGGMSTAELESAVASARELAEHADQLATEAAAGSGTGSAPGLATGVASFSSTSAERPLTLLSEAAATGNNPRSGVLSPDGRHLYVANYTAATISVFARFVQLGVSSQLVLLQTIATGVEPKAIAISPDGVSVYVCDYGAETLHQYERDLATGKLTAYGAPTAATGAKTVGVACSPDGKYVYAVTEATHLVYQYERETSGALKALGTPTVDITETFPTAIVVSPDSKHVYVASSGGGGIVQLEIKAGGGVSLLTPKKEGTEAGINGLVCSSDGESVYAACGTAGKLVPYSRNAATGLLTELATRPAITNAHAVGISAGGSTVWCCDQTNNLVYQFKRQKEAGGEWSLTALQAASAATGTKPVAVLPAPDGLNAYVVNETAKTVSQYVRTVRVKVATQFAGGEPRVLLDAGDASVAGALRPILPEAGVGFTIDCTDPRSTGKVTWAITEEGPVSAGTAVPLSLALLGAMKKEQDWLPSQHGYMAEMWRWDAAAATVHPNSAAILEATKEGARASSAEPVSAGKITNGPLIPEYAPEDFLGPVILGKASDPEYTVEDAFTKWTKVHIPAGFKQTESSDRGVTVIDAPSGRAVTIDGAMTIVGSTIKCQLVNVHDIINGPGYSSNSNLTEATGGYIPLTGAALVAGSSTVESGGPSSARIETNTILAMRYATLYAADKNPFDPSLLQPMRITIRGAKLGAGAPAGAGMAPRGTTTFGQGVVVSPLDGRLPYVFPAHQGEVDFSSNVNALPNGAWLRIKWTREQIEALNAPNWVKWVFWCYRNRGGFVIDCGGQPGLEICRTESLLSYAYREGANNYATSWLEQHTVSDGAFVPKSTNHALPAWRLDITGGGAISSASIFAALEVVKPPARPASLPN